MRGYPPPEVVARAAPHIAWSWRKQTASQLGRPKEGLANGELEGGHVPGSSSHLP
ncbi:hypothetical protein BDP55DRAFT_665080 [Colletotrichum godetiae]|uniref:Uncharacterized protein n=1 Tax=Colletotrichum godetiae TaxID=1209918 RepID=A0AAJ0AK12_9PEZI|nr:uncharacterized protein BDP55DRAFT_665080 [Colletotrichum godetiae]KAK1675300.1 hypothetical protein BDP55DRAFT_665080 [Colletotrichum godetiae]